MNKDLTPCTHLASAMVASYVSDELSSLLPRWALPLLLALKCERGIQQILQSLPIVARLHDVSTMSLWGKRISRLRPGWLRDTSAPRLFWLRGKF